MITKIKKPSILYNGKEVVARKLTVSSELSININTAWVNVQKSALLHFISKGKVTFKPINGNFPNIWSELDTVYTKMLVYNFIPFGGIHSIYFEKIDPINYILQTKEWDKAAKVWNHTISLKKSTNNTISYTDEIVIYGGMLTIFITIWAKFFYKHRQKRWQLVAKNNIQFN